MLEFLAAVDQKHRGRESSYRDHVAVGLWSLAMDFPSTNRVDCFLNGNRSIVCRDGDCHDAYVAAFVRVRFDDAIVADRIDDSNRADVWG